MATKEKKFLTDNITMNQLLQVKHLLTKSQYNLVKNSNAIELAQHIYNDIN